MKIVISNIPSVFPPAYNEQLYLIDTRSVMQTKDYLTVETEGKIQIKNDTSYRKRKIQTVSYDKYTLEFITTETINIGQLNVANEITIIQDNGESHLAELIDFQEPAKLSNSEFRLYSIIYRDLNSKETINHLTYDSTINPDYDVSLVITSIGTYYSSLTPVFDVSEYKRTSNDDNYIDVVSSESSFKTITYTAYLSEDDKNTVLEYVNANSTFVDVAGGGVKVHISYNGTSYQPLETPIVTIDKGELEGIYFITITLSYETILNYPYE